MTGLYWKNFSVGKGYSNDERIGHLLGHSFGPARLTTPVTRMARTIVNKSSFSMY